MRRVPISIKKSTYTVFNHSVSTVKKSQASSCCWCWRRKACQVLLWRVRTSAGGICRSFEDVSNGGAPHPIAQFVQFALDFARAPARILSRQAHSKRFEFRRNPWPAHKWSLSKRPLAVHQLPMPAQHGFWREQEQAVAQPGSRVPGPLDQFASQHG